MRQRQRDKHKERQRQKETEMERKTWWNANGQNKRVHSTPFKFQNVKSYLNVESLKMLVMSPLA